MSGWTPEQMPDQSGRTVVVTGTSAGGIGAHTALEFARRGARVVLVGRSAAKLDATQAAIRRSVPDADLECVVVNLSDLASVRTGGAALSALTDGGAIDVLVNNAGVMATPYSRTVDGLELQLGTNHFGPFLLTGLLWPQLVAAPAARVVAVSSNAHRAARRAPLGDPHTLRGRYARWPAYAESKLANLLFTYELDRRAKQAGVAVTALAAHPGFAATHLTANGQFGRATGGVAAAVDVLARVMAPNSAAQGAWPTLYAATADLPGATYCGPSGIGEMRGAATVVSSSRLSHDEDAQRQLWELSEQVTGVSYP